MTRAELMPEIMKLSVEDRLIIANELWRSAEGLHVDPSSEARYLTVPPGRRETREEFDAELKRRIEDAEKNPNDMVPWEELSRELDKL